MATESIQNPIGIYRNPDTKAEIGCTEAAMADAVVRQGFRLVKECATSSEVNEALAAKAASQAAQAPAKGVSNATE
jgi:hypothetical protein